MDYLNDFEVSLMREDLRDLLADQQLGGSLIYQAYVGRGSFNPSSGGFTETFAGTWINSYARSISDDEVDSSGGRYQLGDYVHYVSTTDIILPKKDDRLVVGSRTRYVVGFTTDSVNIFHSIIVRGL